MRYDVCKYLFIGHWSRQDLFFERAQQLGIIEFISHAPPSQETPADIQTFLDAQHVLRTIVPVEEILPSEDYHSAIVIAQGIVEKNAELEKLREKALLLKSEIARVEPFGRFSVQKLQAIEEQSKRKIQFYFTKQRGEVEAEKREEVIFINSAYGMRYYVAINKEPQSYPGLVEMVIDRSLDELYEDLATVQRKIDEYEIDLSRLAHHKRFLRQGFLNALNQYHLDESTMRAEGYLDDDLFAVEAWIPKNKLTLAKQLASELGIYLVPVKIEKQERIPTFLQNKRFARMGEDLINIYDTPSPFDKDPSLWVFFAFGLFFSMIVGDAGYGLILLAISSLLFWKFGKAGGLARRIILLSISLSIGCIIWGVMTTSFLGVNFAPDSKLRDVSMVNWLVHRKVDYVIAKDGSDYQGWLSQFEGLSEAQNSQEFVMGAVKIVEGKPSYVVYNQYTDNVMMELVIFIGTLHIMLSFLRYLNRNWAGIGWVIFMAGAYLSFPSILHAISLIHYVFNIPPEAGAQTGFYLLFCGIGLAAVLAVVQKKLAGLGEVMNVINVFADVMSYLRIYALSLAGMIMAETFDQIGTSIPLYAGIFIMLAGHTINFTLSLMGGVIHGLRLNFIEWYHYSFEGGGRPLKPLTFLKMQIE